VRQRARGYRIPQAEPLRNRITTLYGLMVALGSLASVVWLRIAPPTREGTERGLLLLLSSQAVLALIAAMLAWRGKRSWGAILMSATLFGVPTLATLLYDLPHSVTLAAYTAVLMITSVGSNRISVFIATALALILGPTTYLLIRPASTLHPALLSIAGLFASIGITFAWLQDAFLQTMEQLKASESHFQQLSHLDPLTGLGNRRQFDQSLAEAFAFTMLDRPIALLILDIDNLKVINDRYGHPIGDRALQEVANAIRHSIRDSDVAARIGGDEFAVILRSGGADGAQRVAERIQDRLQPLQINKGKPINVSVSIGRAETNGNRQTAEELLAAADLELYAARINHPKPEVSLTAPADAFQSEGTITTQAQSRSTERATKSQP
jgi:diguanylate cyclase (GGDEF)-like protein